MSSYTPSYTQPQTFSTMQAQGVARPPKPTIAPEGPGMTQGAFTPAVQPYSGQVGMQPGGQQITTTRPTPAPAPTPGAAQPTGSLPAGIAPPANLTTGGTNPIPSVGGQPNLSQLWQQQYMNARQMQAPTPGTANYQPSQFQGGGSVQAPGGPLAQAPTAQGRESFTGSPGANAVGGMTQQQVMEMLQNPSRYGASEVGKAYDVLNNRLTQSGNADKQRIDEEMASRGLFASTTAGGRLGDLASNLNRQRADFATELGIDQARNFQGDRTSAINAALGYGDQRFGQDIAGFEANQGAGAQAFGQEATAAQLREMFGGNNFTRQIEAGEFGENQAGNRFNADIARNQFLLNQRGQNTQAGFQQFGANLDANQQAYNQRTGSIQGLQGYGQQGFENQYDTAQLNDQRQRDQQQFLLQMLGLT